MLHSKHKEQANHPSHLLERLHAHTAVYSVISACLCHPCTHAYTTAHENARCVDSPAKRHKMLLRSLTARARNAHQSRSSSDEESGRETPGNRSLKWSEYMGCRPSDPCFACSTCLVKLVKRTILPIRFLRLSGEASDFLTRAFATADSTLGCCSKHTSSNNYSET